MTYARAIVAGEDLKMGDVIYEKNGLAYTVKDLAQYDCWMGFAKDNTPKGKPVMIVPELDIKGG